MRLLFWSSPAISVTMIALHTGENILIHTENPIMFFYSYCSKTAFPFRSITDGVVVSIYGTICFKLFLIAVIILYIFILLRQRQLESMTMYIVAPNATPTLRHQRNVVSAKGHFLSFLITLAEVIMFVTITSVDSSNSDSLTKYICDLDRYILFFIPSVNFFVQPLVETMFSENLRDTLFSLAFMNIF